MPSHFAHPRRVGRRITPFIIIMFVIPALLSITLDATLGAVYFRQLLSQEDGRSWLHLLDVSASNFDLVRLRGACSSLIERPVFEMRERLAHAFPPLTLFRPRRPCCASCSCAPTSGATYTASASSTPSCLGRGR